MRRKQRKNIIQKAEARNDHGHILSHDSIMTLVMSVMIIIQWLKGLKCYSFERGRIICFPDRCDDEEYLSFESQLKKKTNYFHRRQKIIVFMFGDTLDPSRVSHYDLISHYGCELLPCCFREVMKRNCVFKTIVVKAEIKIGAQHKREQHYEDYFF